MKQHLLAEQLQEINYEERMILLSLVTGLNRQYIKDEYAKGIKDEESMLRAYGYDVKIGDMIELVYNYTGQFPNAIVSQGQFSIKIPLGKDENNVQEFDTNMQPTYCDALYEIVKELLNKKYIE